MSVMSDRSLWLWSRQTLNSWECCQCRPKTGVRVYIVSVILCICDWLIAEDHGYIGWRLGNAWNVTPFPFCWWFIWSRAFHKPIKREGMQACAALWKDAFRSNSQKLVAERRGSCRGMLLFYQSVVSKWRLSGGWFRGHSADSGICVYDVWLESYLAGLSFY